MIPIAAFGFATTCTAGPVSAFYPSPASAGLRFEPKASADEIQILASPPAENVVILGELSVTGDPHASLHELMVAALGEAMSKGADFVSLASGDAQPGMVLGKMVPSGHGRSMFVAAPLQGSEVGRIAAIPPESTGSIRLILGRYAKKAA